MTKTQKWARERNFAKFRLRGAYTCIRTLEESDFMIPQEKNKLLTAVLAIQAVIYNWEINNKESKKKFMEESK